MVPRRQDRISTLTTVSSCLLWFAVEPGSTSDRESSHPHGVPLSVTYRSSTLRARPLRASLGFKKKPTFFFVVVVHGHHIGFQLQDVSVWPLPEKVVSVLSDHDDPLGGRVPFTGAVLGFLWAEHADRLSDGTRLLLGPQVHRSVFRPRAMRSVSLHAAAVPPPFRTCNVTCLERTRTRSAPDLNGRG